MRRWLIAGGVAVALVVVMLAAVVLVPGIARPGIEGLFTRLLGHPVTITGVLRVSPWPRFGFTADDVRVLGPIGGPDVARLKRLEAEVSFLALLAARIEIGKLVLTEPTVRIAPASLSAGDRARARDWRPRPNPDWGLIKDARIGDGRVIGGQILYVDAVSGRRLEMDRIEAALAMPAGGGPFAASGSLRVNGRPVSWKADAAGMQRLLSGSGMKIAAEARSDLAVFELEGTVARRQVLVLDGRAKLAASSAAAVDRWIGPLFAAPVEGPLDAEARLIFSGARIAVEQGRLTLGEMRARGEAAAIFTGDRVSFSAQVGAELLDVTPFLFVGRSGVPAEAKKAAAGPAGGDADIRVEWQAIKLGHLRGGGGRLNVKGDRKTGITEADFGLNAVFGGEISGRAKITDESGGGSLEGRAVLARLQVETILGHLVGESPMAGQITSTVSVSAGPGAGTVFERVRVQGTATMGAARVLSARLAEQLEPLIGNGREIVDLSFQFSASADRLAFEDMVLRGVGGSVVGGGELDLGAGRLSLALRRPATEGEAAGIRIAGPWDRPEITPTSAENQK